MLFTTNQVLPNKLSKLSPDIPADLSFKCSTVFDTSLSMGHISDYYYFKESHPIHLADTISYLNLELTFVNNGLV